MYEPLSQAKTPQGWCVWRMPCQGVLRIIGAGFLRYDRQPSCANAEVIHGGTESDAEPPIHPGWRRYNRDIQSPGAGG